MNDQQRAAMREAIATLVTVRGRIVEAGGSGWKLEAQRCVRAIDLMNEALAQPQEQSHCKRCNGTGVIPDGVIDFVDGMQLETEIECVRDCPDCTKAQPQDNLNCKSVQKRLATSWGYVKAQPQDHSEQHLNMVQGEPVAIDWNKVQYIICEVFSRCISSADGFRAIRDLVDTSPVRTKDPTDDEIESIMVEQGDLRTITFARAVIAADRKLNGVEK